MRKLREVFRLKFDFNKSNATIARAIGIGETTVEEYLARARFRQIGWPLPPEMDDTQLEMALYPTKDTSKEGYLKPDCTLIHKELQRKGVTLRILWEEYVKSALGTPNCTYHYSTFCEIYSKWRACSETSMMQRHKVGESTFIDYAGPTVPIWNPHTGKIAFNASIFVSVLCASKYLFCIAYRSQRIEDWVDAHKKMSVFYGGVTECWSPDNLKSGVFKSDRYEPTINRTYEELAQHYGVAVIPARVRKPKDKSLVESGVYLVETHILAVLRDRKFFSLAELNSAIEELLTEVNKKPFQKMPGSSRLSLYVIDKT